MRWFKVLFLVRADSEGHDQDDGPSVVTRGSVLIVRCWDQAGDMTPEEKRLFSCLPKLQTRLIRAATHS
jgi:hypothetical protein